MQIRRMNKVVILVWAYLGVVGQGGVALAPPFTQVRPERPYPFTGYVVRQEMEAQSRQNYQTYYVLRLESGKLLQRKPVIRLPVSNNSYLSNVKLSPDGKWVAGLLGSAENAPLFLVAGEVGSLKHQIRVPIGQGRFPLQMQWSPKSHSVAVVYDSDTKGAAKKASTPSTASLGKLVLVDVASGKITPVDTQIATVFWARNENTVVYSKFVKQGRTVSINVALRAGNEKVRHFWEPLRQHFAVQSRAKTASPPRRITASEIRSLVGPAYLPALDAYSRAWGGPFANVSEQGRSLLLSDDRTKAWVTGLPIQKPYNMPEGGQMVPSGEIKVGDKYVFYLVGAEGMERRVLMEESLTPEYQAWSQNNQWLLGSLQSRWVAANPKTGEKGFLPDRIFNDTYPAVYVRDETQL